MKIKSTIFAGLASMAIGLPAVQAAVLDFDGAGICTSDASGMGAASNCNNSAYILQSYGDVAGVVDVSYAAPRYNDGRSLRWWADDYNNLHGVLWADGSDANSLARIDLTPGSGQSVTLTHLDLGAWVNTTRNTTLTISDLNGNLLYSYKGPVGDGSTSMPTSFNGSWSSASGIRIEWEDSAYNVGVDNITYNMAPVPEPESYAMLVIGLAALGALARRRRA